VLKVQEKEAMMTDKHYPGLEHIREGATAETQHLLDIIDQQYQKMEVRGFYWELEEEIHGLMQQVVTLKQENLRLKTDTSHRQSDFGRSLGNDFNLRHNSSVLYWDTPYYSAEEGIDFSCKEVMISGHHDCYILTAKEALYLLVWLKQEEMELQRIVGEEEGEDELRKLRALLFQSS
jgi:hypothetical protein